MDQTGEEFCFSKRFDPEFISEICKIGCMPMATEVYGNYLLLIKLHEKRSILDFSQICIPRKIKKQSKKFLLSVDTAFEECLEEISNHHWDSWFYKPLKEAFYDIHVAKNWDTQFHSIELWEEDNLVAGEIGYVVGSIYTSLSGFYKKNSTGTIQMCSTSKLLESLGFSYWDLGMEMAYKNNLGAVSYDRDTFLKLHSDAANRKRSLFCKKTNAREIIESN